jgi:hypothetical protein
MSRGLGAVERFVLGQLADGETYTFGALAQAYAESRGHEPSR